MRYFFELPEVPGANFEMSVSLLTGKQQLFKDEMSVERSKEKGRPFLVHDNSGNVLKAYPKTKFPDMAPTLEINGVKHLVCPPLSTVQYVVGGLPMLLLFLGGAIGGITGALATAACYGIFRAEGSHASKFMKVAGVILAAFALYLILAMLVTALVHK